MGRLEKMSSKLPYSWWFKNIYLQAIFKSITWKNPEVTSIRKTYKSSYFTSQPRRKISQQLWCLRNVCFSSFSKWNTEKAAAAKSLQSCPTLCDPIDGSPPGSPVPGILQARTLEWVATAFSNAWKWKVKVKLLSCVWLLATPWTVASQAPPSIGFSRQEYLSGVPAPFPNSSHSDGNVTRTQINCII